MFQPHPVSVGKSKTKSIRKFHKLKYDHANQRFQPCLCPIGNQFNQQLQSKSFRWASTHTTETPWTHNYSLRHLRLTSLVIPNIWKTGKVIPLPKTKTPIYERSSYKPISLFSPLAKLLVITPLDCSLIATNNSPAAACDALNRYLPIFHTWKQTLERLT